MNMQSSLMESLVQAVDDKHHSLMKTTNKQFIFSKSDPAPTVEQDLDTNQSAADGEQVAEDNSENTGPTQEGKAENIGVLKCHHQEYLVLVYEGKKAEENAALTLTNFMYIYNYLTDCYPEQ